MFDIVWRPINAAPAAVCRAHIAKLSGKNHLFSPIFDRATDQFLIRKRAVHVGGVDEGDAQVQSAMKSCVGVASPSENRFSFIPLTIELRHAHAAEPNR